MLEKILCTHAREVQELEGEVLTHQRNASIRAATGTRKLKIAITDETFGCWLLSVLSDRILTDAETQLDIQLTNDSRAMELMRCGEVVAGVSPVLCTVPH